MPRMAQLRMLTIKLTWPKGKMNMQQATETRQEPTTGERGPLGSSEAPCYAYARYYAIAPDGKYLIFYSPEERRATLTTDDRSRAHFNTDLASAVLNCPYTFKIRCMDKEGTILGEIPKY